MGKQDENTTTGAVAAERLRAVRKAQGLSLREVAERVAAVGHPLILTAIGKIENGDRRMDVDDLTALAAALGVSPATLLIPDAGEDNDQISVTGVRGDAADVWAWVTGKRPAPGVGDDDMMTFIRHAFPRWMTRAIALRTMLEMDNESEGL